METEKGLHPATNIGRGRSGSGERGMLVLLHFLLLFDVTVCFQVLPLQIVTSGRRKNVAFLCFSDSSCWVNKCDCSGASASRLVPVSFPSPYTRLGAKNYSRALNWQRRSLPGSLTDWFAEASC